MPWWKLGRDTRDERAHSQFAVARLILEMTEERGYDVTPTKLQKLVFLAHAWSLALYGMPLVRGRIEAWQYGPVFPQLYHEIKHMNHKPLKAGDIPAAEERFDPDERELIRWAVERYGALGAAHLSRLTHAKRVALEIDLGKGFRRGDSVRTHPVLLSGTLGDHALQAACRDAAAGMTYSQGIPPVSNEDSGVKGQELEARTTLAELEISAWPTVANSVPAPASASSIR